MKIASIKTARTFTPFDNHVTQDGHTALSPPTSKSVVPTNNVITIQDIVIDHRKYQLPGAGGAWGLGEDSQPGSYKSTGNDYKAKEQFWEAERRKREFKQRENLLQGVPIGDSEVWQVTMNGGSVSFPSFSLAQQYQEKVKSKGVKVSRISRVAQEDKVLTIARAMEKVFMVESIDVIQGVKETGAAFCIAPNYFLTCSHVISKYDKNNIAAVHNFGQNRNLRLVQDNSVYNAVLVDYNLAWDISLLKATVPCEPFSVSPNYQVGEDIFSIGSPHGFENEVSSGILGSLNRSVYSYPNAPSYMFVDASIHTGNSSGPIVKESDGSVVGLVTLIVSQEGMYGLNAALPSSYVEKFLRKNKII